jgi:hypothetical protein
MDEIQRAVFRVAKQSMITIVENSYDKAQTQQGIFKTVL